MYVGTVSYLFPGDYAENALVVENIVDFVELLIYKWDKDLKSLIKKNLNVLNNLDLFYTIHLPLNSIEEVKKAYTFFKEQQLNIKQFVLHPIKGWEEFIKDKEDVVLENLIFKHEIYKKMVIDTGHLYLSSKEDFFLNPKN